MSNDKERLMPDNLTAHLTAETRRLELVLEEYKDWLDAIESKLIRLLSIKKEDRNDDDNHEISGLKDLRSEILSGIAEIENGIVVEEYYFYNKDYFNDYCYF